MQNEPSIAINPKKPTNMIVSYNDASLLATIHRVRPHWSYTTDGGVTWQAGASSLSDAGTNAPLCCDTGVAFDSNGYAYLVTETYGTQILLYVSAPDGSGNAGASWSGPSIVGSGSVDKPAMAIDKTGGTHNGNIYIAWVDYQSGSGGCGGAKTKILLRTATLSGGTPVFSSSAVQASPADTNYYVGPALAVAPSGSLFVAYQRDSGPCQGTINGILVSRSDDGGSTFALSGSVADNSPAYTPSDDAVAANPFPTIATTNNGTVFVAWTDGGSTYLDIQSRASVTNGASWNARVRVSMTTKDQFHPAATFVSGKIYVFYYSRQLDPSNYYGALYLSTSTNGGASFGPNSAFSSTFSDPSVCSIGWTPCLWGDYISADAEGDNISNQACPAWADSRDSQSTGDNDVNVYTKCVYGGIVIPSPPWWWRIIRPPIARVVPYMNKGCPLLCTSRWQADVYSTGTGGASTPVSLTATGLPPGVTLSIMPESALPPFKATISVNFTNAQCTSTTSCLQTVSITASDGTNSTAIATDTTLSNVPYLITDTNVYNPGENVNLTGFGFSSNSAVTVKLDGITKGSSTTGNNGSFNIIVNLASTTFNGTHTLTATDSQSKTASTSFLTPKVEVESASGLPPPLQPPRTLTLTPPTLLLVMMTIGTIAILTKRKRSPR